MLLSEAVEVSRLTNAKVDRCARDGATQHWEETLCYWTGERDRERERERKKRRRGGGQIGVAVERMVLVEKRETNWRGIRRDVLE